MKYAVCFLLLVLSCNAIAQNPKPKTTSTRKPVAAKPRPTPSATPTPVPLSEKEQFDKASAYELAADRVAALEKFIVDFPQSENRTAAADLLASSRILIAEEKLLSGDGAGAVGEYKKLVESLPQPVPNELFTESISKIPATLFARGQRAAAFELATMIENKVETDASQLLELVNFYLRMENGGEAMRLAAKAAAREPNSPAVHRTIALVHRINFDLDLSADSYAKSLELDPESVAAKRGLAEMKRALGKPDEAIVLYRELLSKDENDLAARNGLVLSLFESGDRTGAEAELTKTLERSTKNVTLLAGAAYWYASRGIGDKAVELAQKALDAEPRYIWGHIALGRGLIAQRKPVAAEQVLIKARAFGNFPTLEYEIASARVAAGFFREAVDDLSKRFNVTSSGVATRLGGRIPREEKSLSELVGFERRASIFAYTGADSAETADVLRALLSLHEKLQPDTPNESEVVAAATEFTKGTDKMKLHRQLYAASELLRRKIAIDTVIELVKAATGNSDAALDVPDAGAAVMASELYEARLASFRKNDFLLVPDVPRPTLSSILRGRIEELAGWALYHQNNFSDASIRLRRAISVLPAKSAWWRSSMWRLGAALAADGKDAEALTSYIESYKTDKPDFAKYVIVETLYKKVNNGSLDGLEEKIGRDRMIGMPVIESAAATTTPTQAPTPESTAVTTDVSATSTPEPSPTVEAKPVEAKADAAPVETKTEPAAAPVETKTEPAAAPVEDRPQTNPTEVVVKPESSPVPVETKPDVPPVENKTVTDPAPTEQKLETVPAEVKPEPAAPTPAEQKPEPPTDKIPTADEQKPEPTPAVSEPPPPEPKAEAPITEEAKAKDPIATPTEPPATSEPVVTPTEIKNVDADKPQKPTDDPAIEPKGEEKPLEAAKTERAEPTVEKPRTAPSESTSVGKLLFEPIIITIPNSRPPKPKPVAGDKTTAEKPAVEGEKSSGDKPAEPVSVVDKPNVTGDEEEKAEVPPCTVDVSQENISLINNGGTVGILVSVQGRSEIKELAAVPSSPKDVEVTLEPEIVGLPDRRFFVIKSVSTATGVYQITFKMPCGRKDIIVTVR